MLSPGFLLLRESPSPSSAPRLLPVLPGLKSFAAIWTCLKSWKKLGYSPQIALSCREDKHVRTLQEP